MIVAIDDNDDDERRTTIDDDRYEHGYWVQKMKFCKKKCSINYKWVLLKDTTIDGEIFKEFCRCQRRQRRRRRRRRRRSHPRPR